MYCEACAKEEDRLLRRDRNIEWYHRRGGKEIQKAYRDKRKAEKEALK